MVNALGWQSLITIMPSRTAFKYIQPMIIKLTKMCVMFQSMNSGGPWDKDKPETAGVNAWNVDIFVQVVKDLVRTLHTNNICIYSTMSSSHYR